MKVKARRVGNSLTITIPREVVMELGLTEDTDMNVFVREDTVVVEPATSRWERLVNKVRAQATERGVTEADVESAVSNLRNRESSRSRSGANARGGAQR
jgi:antitoxin component of MazEF toxin-antitoxin module